MSPSSDISIVSQPATCFHGSLEDNTMELYTKLSQVIIQVIQYTDVIKFEVFDTGYITEGNKIDYIVFTEDSILYEKPSI